MRVQMHSKATTYFGIGRTRKQPKCLYTFLAFPPGDVKNWTSSGMDPYRFDSRGLLALFFLLGDALSL
jgi:hypothetical protein